MKKSTRIMIVVPVVLLTVACAAMAAMMASTEKPAASEFGYGPRVSASGSYSVRIEETAKFPKNKMLSTTFVVLDKAGREVNDLTIAVDGGMPQHRHGLPTKPVASKTAAAGQYQIDGLKFSMGGWWVLKLKLQNAEGQDSVVFNFDL
jgi:hypothetical protein